MFSFLLLFLELIIVHSVCEDFKFIQVSTRTAIADFEDSRTFQNASKLVKEFNRGVSLYIKLNKGTQEYYQKCQRKASSAALDHILKQVSKILYEIFIF